MGIGKTRERVYWSVAAVPGFMWGDPTRRGGVFVRLVVSACVPKMFSVEKLVERAFTTRRVRHIDVDETTPCWDGGDGFRVVDEFDFVARAGGRWG